MAENDYIARQPMLEELEDMLDNISYNHPYASSAELECLRDKYETMLEFIKEQPPAYNSDDICNELVQLIGIPCSVSEAEEIMMHKCDDCGDDIPDSECWKRYFETKLKQ